MSIVYIGLNKKQGINKTLSPSLPSHIKSTYILIRSMNLLEINESIRDQWIY